MRRILRHTADRLLTLHGVMMASLLVFFGATLAIWLRPMPANELAIASLAGVAAMMIFAVAAIVNSLQPAIRDVRLRIWQLELHRAVDDALVDAAQLKREIAATLGLHAGTHAPHHPEVWVLPDPDEPDGDPPRRTGRATPPAPGDADAEITTREATP